jgi:hypothetical protein
VSGEETATQPLVCTECGETSEPEAAGWRMYLDVDDEPMPYCPECTEREFESF